MTGYAICALLYIDAASTLITVSPTPLRAAPRAGS